MTPTNNPLKQQNKMDKEKKVLELFNKYYEYVKTTDDGEQRGEWKRDFARQVVKLFCQPDVSDSLPEHKCKYCGVMTIQPDEECYRAPTNNPFDEQVEQEAREYVQSDIKKNQLYGQFFQTFIAGAKSKAVSDKIAELEKQLDGNFVYTPEQLKEHDLIVILKHEESKRATFKPLTP